MEGLANTLHNYDAYCNFQIVTQEKILCTHNLAWSQCASGLPKLKIHFKNITCFSGPSLNSLKRRISQKVSCVCILVCNSCSSKLSLKCSSIHRWMYWKNRFHPIDYKHLGGFKVLGRAVCQCRALGHKYFEEILIICRDFLKAMLIPFLVLALGG